MKLKLANDLSLPVDAVTQTFAIFGKRGSGKTNGATVLVEELLKAKLPVVILDPVDAWWGLKASFDGKGPGFPIYVFGGPHGDLPLEPSAGALIADLVAHERLPMILSMKTWGVAERARFVTDFAKRLLQVNTEPVMMVLEEADAFIPQRPAKGEETMLGAMDRLVRWGRGSGVGCTLITQRSAKVNKDVTTQAETLIAFRTTGPQDRDAIDNWIKHHAGDERREEVLSTLPALATGTAWVWSPEWLEFFGQAVFRRRVTFDSAATPKVGQKVRPPKQLAAVDLEVLRTQMADTVEKAKADDPRELRKTIAALKAEIAAKNKTLDQVDVQTKRIEGKLSRVTPKVVEKPVIRDAQLAALGTAIARFDKAIERAGLVLTKPSRALSEHIATLTTAIQSIRQPALPMAPAPRLAGVGATSGRPLPERSGSWPHSPSSGSPRAPRPARDDGEGLSRMHRAILIVLAQHPEGLTKKQILIHAGYSANGATSAAFADLVRDGWAEVPQPGSLRITPSGLAVLGDYTPLPVGDALRTFLLTGDKLSAMEKRILEEISRAYPDDRTKGEILEAAQYSANGATSATFAKLVALGYAVSAGPGRLRAAAELFG